MFSTPTVGLSRKLIPVSYRSRLIPRAGLKDQKALKRAGIWCLKETTETTFRREEAKSGCRRDRPS